MDTWNKICRVCASEANFDIFGKIPTYLHTSTDELWEKPINQILEETTGLIVSEDDKLPQSICGDCIKNMTQAAIFRDQVVKNTLNFLAINELRHGKGNKVDKGNSFFTELDLHTSDSRKIDINRLVNETDCINFACTNETSSQNVYSFADKCFEEDDIMNTAELRDTVNVNVYKNSQKSKYPACCRQLKLGESQTQHRENCVKFQFQNFFKEINSLLEKRNQNADNNHEFIRCFISSLRKICDVLHINYDEFLSSDEFKMGNNKKGNKTMQSAREIEYFDDVDGKLERNSSPVQFSSCHGEDNTISSNLKDLLLASPGSYGTANIVGTGTPISIHNNILYEIERTQSRNELLSKIDVGNKDDNAVRLIRPIPLHAAIPNTIPQMQSPAQLSEEERATFLRKLEQLSISQTNQQLPATPTISVRRDLMPPSPQCFSAVCNMCNDVFENITDFELHNAMYHNDGFEISPEPQADQPTSDEERERIIAMFENEDDI